MAVDDVQRGDARAGVRCADGGPRRPPTTADLIITEDMSPGRQGLTNAHVPMRVVDSRKAPDTSTFYLASAHGCSDSPVLAGTTQKEAA